MDYTKPIITSMLIDMNKTDVLAGCQGWKDGIKEDFKSVIFRMDEVNEITFSGEGTEKFFPKVGLVRRTIQGMNVIVPVKGPKANARLFLLNESATLIWDYAIEGKTASEIISVLNDIYQKKIKTDTVEADIHEALEQFVKLELLTVSS